MIVDDIMIVGKKQNHNDHDLVLTAWLETTRKVNVKLNYEKLQHKKQEVDFLEKLTQQVVASLLKARCLQLQPRQPLYARNKSNHLFA